MTDWRKFIKIDERILYGKPVIINTRISVELILEKLAEGETIEQILESHPGINKESIMACLSYASDSLKNEINYPIAS
jgi:uncharacterized protein (DUF433 family)